MAGVYVSVEHQHPPIGIQWPPANVPVRSCTHTQIALNHAEATYLAQNHINPIYVVPGKGIMPMGSRTLSKDPIFQQINSRRIMNMIIEQINRDTQWAVFEVNNPHLWTVVGRDIRARLEEFWNAGLLELSEDGEKYFVLCNAENNPRQVMDSGYINIEVRLQPVGTTEQILIDFTVGGA
jgi:phage tail sheath protein FI